MRLRLLSSPVPRLQGLTPRFPPSCSRPRRFCSHTCSAVTMCFGPESPCPRLPLQTSPRSSLKASCLPVRAHARAQPALRVVTLRTKPSAPPRLRCSSPERQRCLMSGSSLACCSQSPGVLRSLAWKALFPEACTAIAGRPFSLFPEAFPDFPSRSEHRSLHLRTGIQKRVNE